MALETFTSVVETDCQDSRRVVNPKDMKHEEECLEDTLADLAKTRDGKNVLEVAREKPVTGLSHCRGAKKNAWVLPAALSSKELKGDGFKN